MSADADPAAAARAAVVVRCEVAAESAGGDPAPAAEALHALVRVAL